MPCSNHFLRAALFYARHGLAVFPLVPRSKEPLLRGGRGHHDATTETDQIREWWRGPRIPNIGIACALSGLVVFDVDGYRGGDDALVDFEHLHGKAPRTWESSARGTHHYFRAPEDARFRGHLLGADCGVEVKHHGYVVAPPSIHPTGIAYRWDCGWHPTEAPIADLPPAWHRALTTRRATGGPLAAVGPARETFLGAAFAACGRLGRDLASGAACAACPWADLHSDGRGHGYDSSAVILAPTSALRVGTFLCAHAHCSQRSLSEVLATLPRSAIEVARARFPREFAAAVYRAARSALREPEFPR